MSPDFLQGGGEMGALMRAHDWERTPLGPPSQWPQPLRTVVRLMLNTGHPMYIWWGPELACMYNDAYRLSIGPERHPGSLGLPAREVWAEIWDIIGAQIDQVMEGRGATWHVDALVPITRNGRREDVYWTYSYSPIDHEESAHGVGGVLVVCTETTKQVLLARQLTAERDRLGKLFAESPAFMALLEGPEHRITLANPRYQELVGERPLVGLTVAEALPETVEQGYMEILDRVYSSGDAYRATGARYLRNAAPGGPREERHLDFVYQPVRDAEGRVWGIFVEGTDVTETVQAHTALKASETRYRELAGQLEHSNRMKDEFLATLAHELRNPLAPLANALALMRMAPEKPEIIAVSRDIMQRQVAQMARLVDDLLDVSRLTRGLVELRRERIDVGAALRDAVETSRPLIEGSQHRLRTNLPDDPVFVEADPTRLVQIFANLLNNAAKFTPPGGAIDLELRKEGGNAVAIVRDTGIGIPAAMLGRVFEMFTQVERSHAATGGGLGIGLTLVRRLVELHGGRVEASSAGTSRGSEFRVTLPLAAADSRAATGQAPHAASERKGLRILVADDNADAAESLAMVLEHSGHVTRVVHDGLAALHAGREFRPDVAILDIAMPALDGLAAARRIREEDWGRDVYLVASSGWGQQSDKEKSRDAGFQEHLTKPIEPGALERLLAEQFG
jgi:signal transduction histidine kinase